jgi:UDP-N-acetylglucosamine--N-acetylmuramyl-(pentapeptide) pyrophosphoryl-undecaprenol N-acetylglucosamine transferase
LNRPDVVTGPGSVVTLFSGGGTGGHLYPALALAGALVERRPDVRPFFVGAVRGLEARVLPARGVEHELLQVEGFRRDALIANLRVIRLLMAALARLAGLFRALQPRLVVVTGGYAGGPAGLMAVLTGTRLVLQEQNSVPGVTTRVLSLFAREVHLAFPEARGGLPRWSRRKVRVTGNPVRPPRPVPRDEAARELGLDPTFPVVLVVGGSQGSRALNQALTAAVRGVLEGRLPRAGEFQILWSTGPTHLESVREALGSGKLPPWLHLRGYIEEMPLALSLADLAVSRAGAMATSEFLAWGVPAVLVPLPTAAADHQTRNARALEKAGAAVHLPEADLSGEALWGEVARLMEDARSRAAMVRCARERGRPHAAREIAGALEALLPPPAGLLTSRAREEA